MATPTTQARCDAHFAAMLEAMLTPLAPLITLLPDRATDADFESLAATAPRVCSFCEQGEEIGEDVHPGSFGFYHLSCLALDMEADEQRREHTD